jgi:hypothetical protein
MKRRQLHNAILLIILLPFIGYGLTFSTTAQELCAGTTIPNGVISMDTFPSTSTNFVAGLLGTNDRLFPGSAVVGDINWLHSDVGEFSTTRMGGQLLSWWTLKNNKNTSIQVTNQSSSAVSLHIQIFDEDCAEIRDFCDQFTPNDTHSYDLSNIVRNLGGSISSGALTGKEGFIVVTPTDSRAIAFPFLHGNMKISHSIYDYEYGSKMWARDTDTLFDCTETAGSHDILTGTDDCKFESVLPSELSQVFSVHPGSNQSRADLVFIAIGDFYNPTVPPAGYRPFVGSVEIQPIIVDLFENVQSCATPPSACFLRVGINDRIPNSDVAFPSLPIEPPGPPTLSPPGGPMFDPPGPPPSPPGKP